MFCLKFWLKNVPNSVSNCIATVLIFIFLFFHFYFLEKFHSRLSCSYQILNSRSLFSTAYLFPFNFLFVVLTIKLLLLRSYVQHFNSVMLILSQSHFQSLTTNLKTTHIHFFYNYFVHTTNEFRIIIPQLNHHHNRLIKPGSNYIWLLHSSYKSIKKQKKNFLPTWYDTVNKKIVIL